MRIAIDDTSELEIHSSDYAVAITAHAKARDLMQPTSTVSIPRSVLPQVIGALRAEGGSASERM